MAYSLQPINCTAATLTLDRSVHGEGVVTVNRAAGTTITLPASDGTGAVFRIFIGTTVTSNNFILQVANATDILAGAVGLTTDIAGSVMPTSATTDTITMNGSTTGGIKGTYIEVADISSGIWALSGNVICTGTEATPFSAAVS